MSVEGWGASGRCEGCEDDFIKTSCGNTLEYHSSRKSPHLQYCLVDDARVVVQPPRKAEVERDGAQCAHRLEELKQGAQLAEGDGASRVQRQGVLRGGEDSEELKRASPERGWEG